MEDAMSPLTERDVQVATDRLVAAFAATSTDEYFACFSPDASFVFHPEASRFDDRAAYERTWADWLASGWRVVSCVSTNRLIQLLGDVAVMSHDVETVTETDGVATTTYERESIVFTRRDDEIVAVHEHLSTAPAAQD
jgi:ketosteroid isomerase-like protein